MRRAIPCVLLIGLVACGGGGSSSTPVTPTPTPTPQANRAPVINSMTFTPSFGIANLTTFNYSAAASDPDGDAVTYNWNIAGSVSSNASGTLVFASGLNTVAGLTVTDGKGGSVSDSRPFVVGSMTGSWTGTLAGVPFTMNLTQPAGGTVTGTWNLPGTPFSGNLDPAALNRIDANAAVTLRCKVTAGGGPGGFDDFSLNGTMDPTGVRVSGGVNGSGFTGDPFVLNK
jgi:immune inhibitor A